MKTYIFTTQVLTTGSIIEAAKSFEIGVFDFKEAANQASHSCLYYVSFPIKANSWRVALKRFNAKMITLEDALAFYYCMPVIWQWWNFSITRRNDHKKRIVVSLYKTEDGVVMSDYDDPPAASILKIMNKIEEDRQFANSLYFHGALCRLDNLEFSRSHLPACFN